MKEQRPRDIFLAGGLLGAAALVMILFVFFINARRHETGFARGVGIIGVAAEQQNALENETTYVDAGHEYVYALRQGYIDSLVARTASSYPFAFACGRFISDGNFLNAPLRKYGDIVFQEYPRGGVYPTWNASNGEYQEVDSLESLHISIDQSSIISPSDITGASVDMQKESCIDMTAGASLVTIASLLVFGVLSIIASVRIRIGR